MQYRLRRINVKSLKVSEARDPWLGLSDSSEILQESRQDCGRDTSYISKRYKQLNIRSTSRSYDKTFYAYIEWVRYWISPYVCWTSVSHMIWIHLVLFVVTTCVQQLVVFPPASTKYRTPDYKVTLQFQFRVKARVIKHPDVCLCLCLHACMHHVWLR